ncbi:MAG: HAD-IIIA family hydrolase, partial [Candidatus Omnitrophica bacterium]|nr:HAD-IIIA family hydrolase [Candidatus Omnitrophota bacterium]
MRKIIFLDRDGVINRDPAEKRYVTRWSDFEFLPYAVATLKKLNKHGYDIIVASNQAGISRGLFTLKDLELINKRMLEALAKEGARIKAAYYCHHHDEDNCSCRKPKTGLFVKAIENLEIGKFRWQDTYFIGDGK